MLLGVKSEATSSTMKKETSIKPTPVTPVTPSTKKPSDPREYPLARDSRGSAAREEIRTQTARPAAPRASRRPVQKSLGRSATP